MAALTDELIKVLLAMPKAVTKPKQIAKIQKKSERLNYPVISECGKHVFELYSRQNQLDPDAYSCGLIYQPGSGEKGTALVRYNGSNHTHYNPLEGALIVNQCHIHRATERYIAAGDKAEKYAETTTRYTGMAEAMACLMQDCNISGLDIELPGASNQYELGLFND